MRTAAVKRKTSGLSSAFTVIELLVVVAIAFIIFGLSAFIWRHMDERNKISRAQTQLACIQAALQDYRSEKGAYPPDLFYIKDRLPRAVSLEDPWGTQYTYTTNDLVFNLLSCGPDRNPTSIQDNIYPGRFCPWLIHADAYCRERPGDVPIRRAPAPSLSYSPGGRGSGKLTPHSPTGNSRPVLP
jgi:type II secretory pathway pseudopilin PulG